MKISAKLMILLPLLLTIALNPLILCSIYLQTINVEKSGNVSVVVDGVEGSLIKTESKVAIKALYFLPEATSFSVQALSGSVLMIDSVVVEESTVRLEAGEHSIYLDTVAPYVAFPSEEVFLNLQPTTNVGRIKPLTIALTVYPRNWDTIFQILALSGFLTILAGVLCSSIIFWNARNAQSKSAQDSQHLQKILNRTRAKVISLIDLINYIIEETGYPEDRFLEELQKRTSSIVPDVETEIEPQVKKPPKKTTKIPSPEEKSSVKIVFPSRDLKKKLRGYFLEEE